MNIQVLNELVDAALTTEEAQRKWGWKKRTPEEMFGDVVELSHEDAEIWSPNKVLKLGSSIKALNISIEWVVSTIIPEHAVSLFFARGGIGKSTIMMMLAGCVASGRPFFGYPVKQRPVIYIDFENSLAVLSERLKVVGADLALFWSSADSPARLDKAEVQRLFKILEQYPGALMIFDTLRSSQSGDENNSEHMSEIMTIFRKLRDNGATVIVLHHTIKAANTRYKGSSAIFDMVDHVLAMYPVRRPGDDVENDDEDNEEAIIYRFGTKDKTRYEPISMFLQFNPETKLFETAPDPADQTLLDLYNLLSNMVSSADADAVKQGDILRAAKDELNLSKIKTIKLLNKGMDRYWNSHRGDKNALLYTPMGLFASSPAPYSLSEQENRNPEGQASQSRDGENHLQNPTDTEFSSLPNTLQKISRLPVLRHHPHLSN